MVSKKQVGEIFHRILNVIAIITFFIGALAIYAMHASPLNLSGIFYGLLIWGSAVLFLYFIVIIIVTYLIHGYVFNKPKDD